MGSLPPWLTRRGPLPGPQSDDDSDSAAEDNAMGYGEHFIRGLTGGLWGGDLSPGARQFISGLSMGAYQPPAQPEPEPEPVAQPQPAPIPTPPAASPGDADQLRTRAIRETQDEASRLARESQPSQSAPQQSPTGSMRAIRLPDGRLIFTNRPEYGGEQFSTEDAGRLLRQQELKRYRALPDPTSAAMSGLLRSSLRAAEAEERRGLPAPVGTRVEGIGEAGTEPSTTGGAASFVEGTTETQDRIKLDDALRALALLQANQEIEKAAMPAAQRAQVENKDVVLADWIRKQYAPQIQDVQNSLAKLAIKERLADQMPDRESQRAAKIAIEQERAELEGRLQNIQGLMSLSAGQRIPQI